MLALLALLAAAPGVAGWAGQQPQLAASARHVFLTAVRDGAIVVLRSDDEGARFDEVSTITPAGTVAAGMRRGPRIAATDRAVIVTAVVGAQGGGKDGDVVLYRSTDDGRTWSEGVVINDVAGSAREGLHAMGSNANGVVALAWLDLRRPGTVIFGAVSRDHGATWTPDVIVYESPSGSVCECCHPSVAVARDGRIGVMFRNQVDGHRDMYLAWSRDGRAFEPAMKLGEGTWPLQACPMDGGGLAIAGDQVVTAWRREDGVFVAAPRQAERRLAMGRDPVVSTGGTHVDIAWTDADGVTLERDGERMKIGPGRFASLLAFGRYTLIAWEQEGRVLVRRLER